MTNFDFGDELRHRKRPEWGTGRVVKAEPCPEAGVGARRLAIRFANAGLKTMVSPHAELEQVNGDSLSGGGLDDQGVATQLAELDQLAENGWLGGDAKRRIEELMISLPEDAIDPLSQPAKRLTATLGLYRFEQNGHGLLDWATAQSQLDDPMDRFQRHELEHFYERWQEVRNEHLRQLLREGGITSNQLQSILDSAPAAAQKRVRKDLAIR